MGNNMATTNQPAGRNNFKYYDMDGLGPIPEKDIRVSSPTSRTAQNCKIPINGGDRFFEEFDYERRLKKRKAKLISATEEAFAHLGRVSQERIKGPSNPMDPYGAAQSIFPHLANCLKYDMSPRAFLERYVVSSPVLQNDREHRPVQPWALICDILLSRNLKAGTVFQLRQGTDISLLCEVHPLPHFSISEEVIDHR